MILNAAMILLMAGWMLPEPEVVNVWAVDCGSYEYVYEAENRMGSIEEVELCQE